MHGRLVAAVGVGLCCTTTAFAADLLLWDQSDVVVPSGVAPLMSFAVADDFTVPGVLAAYRLVFADVWMQDDMELPVDGTLTGFNGTVGWAIYAQAFGEPSTLVAAGSDTTAALLGPTVPACCWDTQRVRFHFDPPVTVTSGAYWLAIREGAWGTPADANPVYASASAQPRGYGTMTAPLGGVPTSFSPGGGSDLAYVVYGKAFPWSQEPYDSLAAGSPVTSAVAANDFTLTEPFTPSRAQVVLADGDATPDGVVDSLGSTLGWGLYADGSGGPGALLYSGTSGPPLTQTILGGNVTVGDYASVGLDLSRVGTLAAGTYWLAVREGPWGTGAADATEVYWLIAERAGSPRCASTSLVSPGSWFSSDSLDLAFSLSAADVVFASSFEAGVTCAWTLTTGGSTCP